MAHIQITEKKKQPDFRCQFEFGGYWHMVLFWGVIAALPAFIHTRLYECVGSSRSECITPIQTVCQMDRTET